MSKRIHKPYPAPPGKSAHELDKFKAVWRTSMPEDVKQAWRKLLNSRTTNESIRAKLLAEYDVNVNHGTYVTRLRYWVEDQDEYDTQRAKLKEHLLQVKKKLGPNATLDQMRVEVLKCSYDSTLDEGDFKQGLATVREDVRAGKLALDTRKVELLEKIESKSDEKEKKLNHPQLTPEERAQRIKQIYGNV